MLPSAAAGMSPKQWFALLAFYISYLFFGASVFYHEEHYLETQRRLEAVRQQRIINDLLIRSLKPMDDSLQQYILEQVNDYCEKPVTAVDVEAALDEPYVWTFYHSFFFSFTVSSTVGYGNISPNNTFGRIFIIFYALVGLPVNAVLFAYLGDYFGKTFRNIYKKYHDYRRSNDVKYRPRKISFFMQIMMYLIPGILLFIFVPACLFTYFEDWDYSISVYYAFITLTTIGFGDFVPTFQAHQERTFGPYFILYQIFIFVWFIAGLGYLVMILGFLVKGVKSKKIAKIEQHLAENIRDTNIRLWHNLHKDMLYIKKVLGDFHLTSQQKDECDNIMLEEICRKYRSESCPDLTYHRIPMGVFCAKRAQSDNQVYKKQMESEPLRRLSLKYDPQRRLSLKYDPQRTVVSTQSRNHQSLDVALLSELMQRVVNTFDAERKTSEQLYYDTYHGDKDDLKRLPLEREYFRERAKSVSILKNSVNFVVKPHLRNSLSSINTK